MRKLIFTLGFLTTVFAGAAQAAWSPPIGMGVSTIVGTPSCAGIGGKAICAAQSMTNNVYVREFNGTSWSSWISLPGAVATDPSCADDGVGKIVCVAKGAFGYPLAHVYDGAGWTQVAVTTDRIASKPSCAMLTPGNVLCVARGQNGGLTSSVFNGTAWSAFTNLAVNAYSAPGCASDRDGRVICILMNTNRGLIGYRYEGAAWSAELDLGVWKSTTPPVCSELGAPGRVMCLLHYTNGGVYFNEFQGGAWTIANWLQGASWSSVVPGGVYQSNLGCAAIGARRIVCAGMSIQDSGMWVTEYNAGTWSAATKAVPLIFSPPACGTVSAGVGVCMGITQLNRGTSTKGP